MTLDRQVRDLNRRIIASNGGHMPGTLGALLVQRDDWETPPDLFASYHAAYDFTLDPCANFQNCAVAWYYDREQDGLRMRWRDVRNAPPRVWLHPPHSEPGLWSRKAVIESRRGALVVALLPARTGDGWWHEFVLAYADDVRYLRGTPGFRLHRLPVNPSDQPGRPLPIGGFAVVTWRPR